MFYLYATSKKTHNSKTPSIFQILGDLPKVIKKVRSMSWKSRIRCDFWSCDGCDGCRFVPGIHFSETKPPPQMVPSQGSKYWWNTKGLAARDSGPNLETLFDWPILVIWVFFLCAWNGAVSQRSGWFVWMMGSSNGILKLPNQTTQAECVKRWTCCNAWKRTKMRRTVTFQMLHVI